MVIRCVHGDPVRSRVNWRCRGQVAPVKSSQTRSESPRYPKQSVPVKLLPPECRLHSPHRLPSRCVPPCIYHSGSGDQPLPAPLVNSVNFSSRNLLRYNKLDTRRARVFSLQKNLRVPSGSQRLTFAIFKIPTIHASMHTHTCNFT